MYKKSMRSVAVISSIIENILDTKVHIISKPLILMLFMFACFNLIVPAEIIADETESIEFGLYKDGEKILEWESDIDPSVFDIGTYDDLSPLAKKYLDYVKKNDDYYRHPSFVFSRLVRRCKNLVDKVHSENLDVDSPQTRALSAIIPEIIQVETELRESSLKADITSKQDVEREKVKARTAKLIELLESCQLSVEQNDNSMYNNSIEALIEHFNEMDSEREKYRKAVPRTFGKPVIEVPRELLKVKGGRPKSAPAGSKDFKSGILLDVPDDSFLEETIDIQFTPEITALAGELNFSPVEIYKYVRDNFDFDVYVGSRKGSQQTLDEGAGNDHDLASLLIALLRVSGFYAGYQNVTRVIPEDRICNWLGVEDHAKAWDLLDTEGFYIVWDQQNSLDTLEMVIVAAYLPDVNYRGANNDSNSKNWIPLDPTFKQYQYNSAINMLDELPNPFETHEFIVDYYSTERPETPLEWFQQAMIDSLAVYHPGAVYDDLIRTRTVIEETDEILPGTLPYTVAIYGSPYAEIPENMRYEIRFRVRTWVNILSYTISMPEIAGKQITVSYKSSNMQGLLDEYGIYNFPPVNFPFLALQPKLNIDGCEVASAQGASYPPQLITVWIDFFPPESAPPQSSKSRETYIGDYVGIGLNTGSTIPVIFDDPQYTCDTLYAGQVLHQTAMSYLNSTKAHDDEFRKLLHTKSSRDISVAFTFNDISIIPNYLYDIDGYIWEGFIISSGGGSEYGVSTDLGCSPYDKEYNRLSGADGSIGENRVFEVNFDAKAISAIKALQITNDRDLPICDNIVTGLDEDCPLWRIFCPDLYEDQIEDRVDLYLAYYDKVIMPERWQTYDNEGVWEGYGMLALDNVTGRSAYGLAGHIIPSNPLLGEGDIHFSDGGATIYRWPIQGLPDLYCFNVPQEITVDPPAPGDLYWAGREDYLTFTVPVIIYWGRPNQYLVCRDLGTETDRQIELPFSIRYMYDHWGAGDYTLVVGPPEKDGDCDLFQCLHGEKTITIVGMEVILGNSVPCDGNDVNIWLDLPAGLPTPQNVIFSATPIDQSYGNPIGHTNLAFDPFNPNDYSSRIQNSIWYSTQANIHCNVFSSYNISATADIGGVNIGSTDDTDLAVGADFVTCIWGKAWTTQGFSGNGSITTTYNPNTSQWESVVDIGTFHRDVQGTHRNTVDVSSQYWQMVEDEEVYHVGQYEGIHGNICDDLWDPNLVMEEVDAGEPYVGATYQESWEAANTAFNNGRINELNRSRDIVEQMEPVGRKCQIEREAKNAVGSSFRVAMPCAYSGCP